MEDVAAGEGQGPEGHPHELAQANDRWQQHIGPQLAPAVVLKPFRFSLQHHHRGAPPGGDIERLIGGIENEYSAHAHVPGWLHANETNQVLL